MKSAHHILYNLVGTRAVCIGHGNVLHIFHTPGTYHSPFPTPSQQFMHNQGGSIETGF